MTLYFFHSLHLQSWIIRAVIRVFLCFANISSSSILYLLKVKVVNYEVYEMIYMRGGVHWSSYERHVFERTGNWKWKREKKSLKGLEREKKKCLVVECGEQSSQFMLIRSNQTTAAYPQIATPYVGAVTISNAVAHGSQPVCLRPRLDCVPQLLSYHRSQYYNLVSLSLILLLLLFLSQINTKKLRLNDGFLVLKDHEDKF